METALLCPTSNFGNSSVASLLAEYTELPPHLRSRTGRVRDLLDKLRDDLLGLSGSRSISDGDQGDLVFLDELL